MLVNYHNSTRNKQNSCRVRDPKEEKRYVQQMLVENPVIVERRGLTTNTTSGSEEPLSREEQLRPQRAESCRRSCINIKINKAKIKYRHRYIFGKYSQNVQMLEHLRNIISQAESHLTRNDLSKRAGYGLE
ncbi:protein sisterless A-like [Teleopsis dalmanni]|uniref:protein sisterless A-like n=1 Tax=Teleopsis dalmanni TaxID=139649 RepID=UPI0018CE41BA|nr:protein sisterless A-like [Teleopsis dalmanni]